MSLYIGTGSSRVVDLIANKDNEAVVKELLKKHYLPVIGSIKLIARPSIPNISGIRISNGVYYRNSDLFAGWVVGNGSKFSKTDFSSAFEVFGDRYGADASTFTIPNLYNFYKLDNSAVVESTPEQQCKSILSSHHHEIHTDVKFSESGNIQNTISAVTTGSCGKDGAICDRETHNTTIDGQISTDIPLSEVTEPGGLYEDTIPVFHNGSGDWTRYTSPMTIGRGADFSNIITNYAGDNGDCWPAHTTIIPMLYIGADII